MTWLALAAALLLAPRPAAAVVRARALADRAGSLAGTGSRAGPIESSGPPGPPVPAPPRPVSRSSARAVAVLAGAGVVVAIGLAVGPVLGLAAAVAALTAGRLARTALAARRDQHRRAQLSTAVRLVTAEVAAGARPVTALAAGADAAPAFRDALVAAARAGRDGASVAGVLGRTPELGPLAHAWRLAESGGAALGEVLAGVADDLAARDETRRAVAAAVAGARSSAGLLAGLPVLGIGLGAAMGARPVGFLTGSTAGQLTGCAGVLLDVAGVLWTQRLIRRAARG